MRMLLIPVCLLCTPPAALAADAMSADEFDAYTNGQTFFYANDGQAYGAEEYLDNRRVRWSFLDGRCQEGVWYEESDQICFIYENQLEPQCWRFEQGPAGLIAQFRNDPNALSLYEVKKSSEPLMCLGPEVGV